MLDGSLGFGHALATLPRRRRPCALALVSSLLGFVIGALPGLTATMGVALMTTLTLIDAVRTWRS